MYIYVYIRKNCKYYHRCKRGYSWNSSTWIYENSKYLKGNADTSVIECDEFISVMNIVSTKMITKNCYSEKVRDCYILSIICYYQYAKQKGLH